MQTNVAQLTTGDYTTQSDVNPGGGDSPGFAPGQLGKSVWVDAKRGDPGIPAGEAGRIQYVKAKASTTVSPARGVLAYWDDKDDFVVTQDNPTVGQAMAGIWLGATAEGSHGWIWKEGRCTAKFLSSTTKTTPAVGDAVVNYGASGLADVLADATPVVFGTDAAQANRVIGHLAASVSSQLALIDLLPIPD